MSSLGSERSSDGIGVPQENHISSVDPDPRGTTPHPNQPQPHPWSSDCSRQGPTSFHSDSPSLGGWNRHPFALRGHRPTGLSHQRPLTAPCAGWFCSRLSPSIPKSWTCTQKLPPACGHLRVVASKLARAAGTETASPWTTVPAGAGAQDAETASETRGPWGPAD